MPVEFVCCSGLNGLVFIPELDGSLFVNGLGGLLCWLGSQWIV